MKNLIFAASILLFASWTHAAGFDCNKASTLVEKAICSDSELSKIDLSQRNTDTTKYPECFECMADLQL